MRDFEHHITKTKKYPSWRWNIPLAWVMWNIGTFTPVNRHIWTGDRGPREAPIFLHRPRTISIAETIEEFGRLVNDGFVRPLLSLHFSTGWGPRSRVRSVALEKWRKMVDITIVTGSYIYIMVYKPTTISGFPHPVCTKYLFGSTFRSVWDIFFLDFQCLVQGGAP